MDGPLDIPMPRGMAWNMVYDSDAGPGTMPPTTREALCQRLEEFLQEVIHIAQEAAMGAGPRFEPGRCRLAPVRPALPSRFATDANTFAVSRPAGVAATATDDAAPKARSAGRAT